MKSIALFYGHVASNVGDIAINKGEIATLRAAYPDAEIQIVLLGATRSQFRTTSLASFGEDDKLRFIDVGRLDAEAITFAADPHKWLEHCGVEDADMIVLAAGEHLFSYADNPNYASLFWRTLPAFAARQAGKPCVMMPSTFGPFETEEARALMKDLIESGTDMAVRDTCSLDALHNLGTDRAIPALLDPAFFIPPPEVTETSQRRTIGVIMRSEQWGIRLGTERRTNFKPDESAHKRNNKAYRFTLELCRRLLSESDCTVTIFIQTEADRSIAETVAGELGDTAPEGRLQAVRVETIEEYLDALGAVSVVIASRFHALILGMVCGKPGLGLYFEEHGHKIPGLMELLSQPNAALNLSRTELDHAVDAGFRFALTPPENGTALEHRLADLRVQTQDWSARARDPLAPHSEFHQGLYAVAATLTVSALEMLRERLDTSETNRKALEKALEAERKRAETFSAQAHELTADLKTSEAGRKALEKALEAERKRAETFSAKAYRLKNDAKAKAGQIASLTGRLNKLQNSMSYRVGRELVLTAKSPQRAFFLPKRAWAYYANRRFYKQNSQLKLFDLVPDDSTPAQSPIPKRIAYVLHNSLPYSSGGYAARAHGLSRGLIGAGHDVVIVTRPGYPLDTIPDLKAGDVPLQERIDEIAFERILSPKRTGASAVDYISKAADALTEKFQQLRPEIVIAASNYQTALPALIAARRCGLPFIYEVRGFWEITRTSREPEFVETTAYEIQEVMEAETAKRADHVFTLTGPMKQELVRRGVTEEQITLLPNSCDPTRFFARERDQGLAAKLGIPDGVPVIGYIGSFVQYEGLENLAQACAILARRGLDFRLLLVGNENVSGNGRGPITEEIERVANEEGLADRLIMPGRIPHEEVEAHYSLIDIAPFPRKGQPVTEMVSPMKPLEAFAMKKAVVASSVAALREMVRHEVTGLVFEKDNITDLADMLERLIRDPDLRNKLGKAGREWVEGNRTWEQTGRLAAQKVESVSIAGGDREVVSTDTQSTLYRSIRELSDVISQIERHTAQNSAERQKEILSVSKKLRAENRLDDEVALLRYFAHTESTDSLLRALFWASHHAGDYETSLTSMAHLEELYGPEPTPQQTAQLATLKNTLTRRAPLESLLSDKKQFPITPNPRRIAYVLHNSLPYASGGYATRAQGLAHGFRKIGYDVVCIGRPGFPIDLSGFEHQDVPETTSVEGIPYHHIISVSRRLLGGKDYIAAAADALEVKFREVRPEIVVAASNHLTALPSLIAARRCGLPFFYEVRGFWEVTRVSREPDFELTAEYKQLVYYETLAALKADHTFTLTNPMKQELVRRGVPKDHITLLPNSCDPARFFTRERDQSLAAKLGIPEGVPVIGYIGSFVQYEGLENLAQACAMLARRGLDFRLLLVGNENVSGSGRGPITAEIERVANEEGLADRLIMPGRIPHDDVESHYSLIDIAPFPRKGQPVTEMVSPMKPLEAFAMEKAVVASSVAALREMVRHEETGLIYEKDNVQHLADTLERLIQDPELRNKLGKAGRKWVEEERTWEKTARIFEATTQHLKLNKSSVEGFPVLQTVGG